MPRIDPIQLLNCLSVLLSSNGGIKSRDEVQRLASLMIKFSKKLVSKCIYIQILKCTETDLLGLFMGSGGWVLVHQWLTESIVIKNWPLVKELLELLLLCPVDIERLKTNNCPKLVKELSKDGNHFAIKALASKLVEQWLKTVKGEHVVPLQVTELNTIISEADVDVNDNEYEDNEKKDFEKDIDETEHKDIEKSSNHAVGVDTITDKDVADTKLEDNKLPVLKISLKDGKQVLSQIDENDSKQSETSETGAKEHKSKSNDKSRDRERDRDSHSINKSSSFTKSSSRKHSSSSDKHRSSHKSSSSRHSSKDGSKDKHSSSTKSKSDSKSSKSSDRTNSHSSSKSKEERRISSSDKEKNKDKIKEEKNDKSKDSLGKPNSEKPVNDKINSPTPSIHKLGKIPKLSDVKKEKPSISIEVRKPDEPKPKTVKTFHSKFRKHGLEEEVKPPPSRASLLNKKPPPLVAPPTVPIPKRPSPMHNDSPPEKKPKTVEPVEKPGSIKLIPPKPKPMMLLESDMFMDALNASATNKKEPKKRKRRTSGSKDGNAPNDGSPPHTPTLMSSPSSEKSVPPRFYQDTLDADDNKEKSDKSSETNETESDTAKIEENMETLGPHTLTINGLKGVLCYHKRKGPKKSIRWKPEGELEEIQYFELDETERVNVTKNFTDMKYLERIHEREAFQKGRNLSNDDVMEEKTPWKPLIPIDLEGQIQVEHGKNSKEKDIQAIRQKGTLQPLYFHKSMIPDSALEPEPETHPYSEPAIIPLEDVTGNQDNVTDFRNMPWPEPKGNAPPPSNINVPAAMFPSNIPQFPNGFPNPQFPGVPGVPGFQGPNIVPGEWQNGMPHPMMNPMTPGAIVPGTMPPGNMPAGMIMPNENMMLGPDMFAGPSPMFPMPPEGFNMQQNMFPVDFNMSAPQGPPGPDGFAGPGNFRGAMRGRGVGGHWRGKNAGNWDNSQRGRGGARGSRKTVCIYFQRKGSCRQGDNCSFLHPGVNGPYV